jgi:hypothetical protein
MRILFVDVEIAWLRDVITSGGKGELRDVCAVGTIQVKAGDVSCCALNLEIQISAEGHFDAFLEREKAGSSCHRIGLAGDQERTGESQRQQHSEAHRRSVGCSSASASNPYVA